LTAAPAGGNRASARPAITARTTAIELAWLWLRHQPDSALSRWFRERVGNIKGRIRKIAIVALARKLVVVCPANPNSPRRSAMPYPGASLSSASAPGSNGSPGTESRMSPNTANNSTENKIPATAAARGVRRFAFVSLAWSAFIDDFCSPECSDCVGLVMSVLPCLLAIFDLGAVRPPSADVTMRRVVRTTTWREHEMQCSGSKAKKP
jgi:hypothetical protein